MGHGMQSLEKTRVAQEELQVLTDNRRQNEVGREDIIHHPHFKAREVKPEGLQTCLKKHTHPLTIYPESSLCVRLEPWPALRDAGKLGGECRGVSQHILGRVAVGEY